MEAEGSFLLVFQEGKKLFIWAAVTCWALVKLWVWVLLHNPASSLTR